jgi:hypothetical protein
MRFARRMWDPYRRVQNSIDASCDRRWTCVNSLQPAAKSHSAKLDLTLSGCEICNLQFPFCILQFLALRPPLSALRHYGSAAAAPVTAPA